MWKGRQWAERERERASERERERERASERERERESERARGRERGSEKETQTVSSDPGPARRAPHVLLARGR